MRGNEVLGVPEATEAMHAFNAELVRMQWELEQTRNQAKLGQFFMPGGSTRERIFVLFLRFRAMSRDHGFGFTVSRATRKVLVKLHLLKPPVIVEVPVAEVRPDQKDRVEKVRAALLQAQTAFPALQQYHANLEASKNAKGPSYVEHSPAAMDGDPLVKLIAFYLPQFHPIPENEAEWGRGFTEWNNVTRAVPQYLGQYQPHLPEDVGFYDLRIREVQERQVDLAKQYGLYGFAIYYYWFAGKRVLEKPLDSFVENPNIDFPFCLIWANENWTRRWDGHEDDVFLAQVHTPESDLDFIRDAEKYLRHPNYIKVDGKPLLIVYKSQLLPDPAKTVQQWRDYARTSGIGELHLVAAQTMGFTDPTPFGFDAAMQFPPHNEHMTGALREDGTRMGPTLLNPDFEGEIYSYPAVVHMKLYDGKKPDYKLYETAMPMWDNTARRPTDGWIYAHSTPELYRLWLMRLCSNALAKPNPEDRIVFLNAWNEWAEGAHLEPDRRYGYAYLKATQEASLMAEALTRNSSYRADVVVPVDQNLVDQLNVSPSDDAGEPEIPRIQEATFVYQMGKVGSMSVVTELEDRKLGQPIIHSHMLSDLDQMIEIAWKHSPNPDAILFEIQRGTMVREWMANAAQPTKWNVITMTREPVGRNISAFFQTIETLVPNIEARLDMGDLFVDELHQLFLQTFNSRAPQYWFDRQLKPVFGIDVYSEPYDFEKGYKILTAPHVQGDEEIRPTSPALEDQSSHNATGNPKSPISDPRSQTRVLVIRMEDLTRSIQPAMQEFMSLPDFPSRRENTAEQKFYARASEIFKQKPLPDWYVDAMYSTRYATHFYTKEELKKLKQKWTEAR